MYYEDTCPCILISGRYILVLTILQRGCRQGQVLSFCLPPARARACLACMKPWELLTRNKVLIREVWAGLRCGTAALGSLAMARWLVTGLAEPPVRARPL